MGDLRRPVIALTALLVASSTAVLFAEPAGQSAAASAPAAKLECSVQGSPDDRPDDLYVRNVGKTVIPKGTKVEWTAAGTTLAGDITLQTALTPGAGTFVKDVVKGGLEPGHECTCLVTSHSVARAAPTAEARRPAHGPPLGCVVRGTPPKFPDDIYILNNGNSPLPKGATILWSIPDTDRAGEHTLDEALAPGKGLTLAGVVTGGMPVGVKCRATVK